MQPPAFDRATVDHLAELAALSLSDVEAEAMARELGAIVAYVQELGAVDISSVRAITAETPGPSWRDDVPVPGLSREDALGGAPQASAGGFAVPAFVSAGTGSASGGGR